eukprot:TRINITY_DN24206_c0_g1_i2.p1 TRINITY_DN24206_c0_g1~~TRINITY_DN24206_c0_g1_i2.p1  ORF type:complete len:352 (+),score=98.80 TRINITY_DN24206_c0_g1_i2:31-1086(+)
MARVEADAGEAPQDMMDPALLRRLSLATLVVQNSAIKLTMRASRQRQQSQLYLTSVAVVMCELLKLSVSVIALAGQRGGLTTMQGLAHVKDTLIGQPRDTARLLIPAGLYTLQNNLLYVAASHLDAAVFQVFAQAKLIATAVLSRIFLSKQLSGLQWFSIGVLTAGVSLLELSELGSSAKKSGAGDPRIGFAAVMLASLTSAGAGVYLENLVKFTAPSVSARNAQLASIGLPFALTAFFWKDWDAASQHGMFVGFDWLVWSVVAQQAFGGVLTAIVVKYADNVLKGFACGLAVLVTVVVSWIFLSFRPTLQFAGGAVLVVGAVALYNVPSGQPPAPPDGPQQAAKLRPQVP